MTDDTRRDPLGYSWAIDVNHVNVTLPTDLWDCADGFPSFSDQLNGGKSIINHKKYFLYFHQTKGKLNHLPVCDLLAGFLEFQYWSMH